MTPTLMLKRLPVLLVPFVSVCAVVWCVQPTVWRPHNATELLTYRVYAYHDWQSTDLFLEQGQCVQIKAQGEWLYSPAVGRHGPEGGMYAPDYYPLQYAKGGALVGRIGETGDVFYVGKQTMACAPSLGFLYLRINDDILTDNSGSLSVQLERQNQGASTGKVEIGTGVR
jgi:hypothetical protein